MSNYSFSTLSQIVLSAGLYTVNDISANLSAVDYLDSSEVGQQEIVNTINAILSAFKHGEDKNGGNI